MKEWKGYVIQKAEPEQRPRGSSGPGLAHILGPRPSAERHVHTPCCLLAPAPPHQVPHDRSYWWPHLPGQQSVSA